MLTKISRNIVKMAYTSALVSTAMLVYPKDNAKAAGNQAFTSLSYFNPAHMDFIDNFKFTIGGFIINVHSKFTGTHLGLTGKSKSNPTDALPYGQIIYRIPCLKKLVIGFDVSTPQFGHLKYKGGNLEGTRFKADARNYSPKVSYQIFDNVTLGFGLDILYTAKSESTFRLAPVPIPAISKNTGHGSSLGWDAGFLWKVVPGSYISGSYHSKQKLEAKGYSTNTLYGLTTWSAFNAPLPDTFSLNYLQFLSKNWFVNFNVKYLLWKKVLNNETVRNAAGTGTVVTPLREKNSWMGQFKTRYQFAEQWAGLGYVELDSNPQPKAYRPVEYPADTLWTYALGIQYMPTKTTEFQFLYGIAYSNPSINNITTLGRSIGKNKILVNFFDMSFTYKF